MKVTKSYLKKIIKEELSRINEEWEEEEDDPFQSIHRQLDQRLITKREELKPELEDIIKTEPRYSKYAKELLMLLKQKNGTLKVYNKLGHDLGFSHPSEYD